MNEPVNKRAIGVGIFIIVGLAFLVGGVLTIGNLHSTGQLAITELMKAGFKRPGAVLPRGLDRLLAWSFGGGIQAGNFELPVRSRVPICYVGKDENFLPESSFPEIKAWMKRNRPDVLITTDPKSLHLALAHWPQRHPKIRICSLDFHHGFTSDFGVDQHNEAVGAAAVDLIVAQLHRGERGISTIQRTLQIEGKWVGQSSSTNRPEKTFAPGP